MSTFPTICFHPKTCRAQHERDFAVAFNFAINSEGSYWPTSSHWIELKLETGSGEMLSQIEKLLFHNFQIFLINIRQPLFQPKRDILVT